MVDGVAETLLLFRNSTLVFAFACLGVIVPGFNVVILMGGIGGCANAVSREGPVEASIEGIEWI